MSARSIIKLSAYQAESRRVTSPALCLFYIVLFFAIYWTVSRRLSQYLISILLILFVILAIYLRTRRRYRCFLIAEKYLHTDFEIEKKHHGKPQLLGFGIFIAALRISIFTLMLCPSAICIYEGIISYSMSGERIRLAAMLAAALCFAISGGIFGIIILSCLAGAEYYYFSGIKCTPLSAAEYSLLTTYSLCGDFILLKLKSLLCFGNVRELSRLNFYKNFSEI